MQRIRNAINRAKAITACTIAGLNAHPAITTTFNAVAWLVVEVANEKHDEG